jgi:SAM-dependent methyltransferase
MHPQAFAFVEQAVKTTPMRDGLVVEIGGRNINGTIRALFKERPYVSLDITDGPGVDVVADGATYRPKKSPAVVVCCEVLEHTAAAEAICRNAHRILMPGGVFIVTAATEGRPEHSAVDGGPRRSDEFYRNVSFNALRAWLKPFKNAYLTANHVQADIYAVAVKADRRKR